MTSQTNRSVFLFFFLSYVFHCYVSQMRWRFLPIKYIFVFGIPLELSVKFRASKTSLSFLKVFLLIIIRWFLCYSSSLFVRLVLSVFVISSVLLLVPREACVIAAASCNTDQMVEGNGRAFRVCNSVKVNFASMLKLRKCRRFHLE